MEEGPSVAKEDGALVSTVGRALVARDTETAVSKNGDSLAMEEGIPPLLEPETSVAGEDGTSVTR